LKGDFMKCRYGPKSWLLTCLLTLMPAAVFNSCASTSNSTDEETSEGEDAESTDQESTDQESTDENSAHESNSEDENNSNSTDKEKEVSLDNNAQNPEDNGPVDNLGNQSSDLQQPAAAIPETDAASNAGAAASSADPASDLAQATPAEPAAIFPSGSSKTGGLVTGYAGTLTSSALPEMGSKMPYVVKPGDTLAKIAKKVYKDASKWKLIAKFSNIKNPNLIYPTEIIYYQLTEKTLTFTKNYKPELKEITLTLTDTKNKDKIVVNMKEGDTLGKISLRVLGTSKLWKKIWKENPHITNPNQVPVGTKISISKWTQKTSYKHKKIV